MTPMATPKSKICIIILSTEVKAEINIVDHRISITIIFAWRGIPFPFL